MGDGIKKDTKALGVFVITIHHAEGLSAQDRNGKSDPYIVLDTDDVGAAAEAAWSTRMSNMGQACNSNKRIIVSENIYADFVEALVGCASQMTRRTGTGS